MRGLEVWVRIPLWVLAPVSSDIVGSNPTRRTNHPAPSCMGGPLPVVDRWGRVVSYAFSSGYQ